MLFSRKAEIATAVSHDVTRARMGVERAADDLAKTLDELLEATNKSNADRRGEQNGHHTAKPRH